jgi:hypothetical protein
MTPSSPIDPNPSTAPPMLPDDSTDDAPAIPTAIHLGERGTCPNASSHAHAQHVTLPTATDLEKLQHRKGSTFGHAR